MHSPIVECLRKIQKRVGRESETREFISMRRAVFIRTAERKVVVVDLEQTVYIYT